jgi:hypothetical protein
MWLRREAKRGKAALYGERWRPRITLETVSIRRSPERTCRLSSRSSRAAARLMESAWVESLRASRSTSKTKPVRGSNVLFRRLRKIGWRSSQAIYHRRRKRSNSKTKSVGKRPASATASPYSCPSGLIPLPLRRPKSEERDSSIRSGSRGSIWRARALESRLTPAPALPPPPPSSRCAPRSGRDRPLNSGGDLQGTRDSRS